MEKRILVLPGDLLEIKNKENHEIIIGPGLRKDRHDSIVVIKSGALRQKENNFFWIDSHQKRVISNFSMFNRISLNLFI